MTDNVRATDESNPRGYFEFEAVKRLRSDQTWLDQARGRAVKIIHLLLRELPVDGRFEYRVLFMLRPIAEVLASQRAMLARQGKQAASASLAGVFESQVAQAQEWMRTHSCFSFLTLEHHRVLQQPEESAAAIAEFLATRPGCEGDGRGRGPVAVARTPNLARSEVLAKLSRSKPVFYARKTNC